MLTIKLYPTSFKNIYQQRWNSAYVPTQTDQNAYLNIKEVVADDDTSYIQCGNTVFSIVEIKVGDPGVSGVISNVRLWWRVKHATATGYSRSIINGNSAYRGATKTSTTAYQNFYQDFAVNPVTGLAWTWADVYGASCVGFGVEGWNSAVKSNNRMTQFYIEVTYTASGYSSKVNGVIPSKVNGVIPSKVNGI